MSVAQLATCEAYLARAYVRGFRTLAFGLCIGADEEAARLAVSHGYRLHGYPAYESGHPMRSEIPCDVVEPVPTGKRPEQARNRTLVLDSAELLAAPLQDAEERRSGTWSTIRLAWAFNLPTCILHR